jgi:hypothetical protein
MKPIEDLFNTVEKPILLLGKGPTFSERDKFLLPKFFTVTLNHAAREQESDLCSIIDIDVFQTCGEEIYKNSKSLVLPWHPHEGFRASTKNLEDWLKEIPLLQKINQEGRLYWYNLSTYKQRRGQLKEGSKTYPGRVNNGDTFYGVCAINGFKKIYSLGIDGGTSYASEFNDLKPFTNGQKTFDAQMPLFSKISKQNGSKLIPLGKKETIQVFAGSDKAQLIPTLVLDYSIKKHTMNPSIVVPLHLLETKHRTPKNPKCRPRTPFSFKRFFIPQFASGKAFYMDSDMQVFKDMSELLELDFEDNEVLYSGGMDNFPGWKSSNFAMLLIDCDKVSWNMDSIIDQMDEGKLSYSELMFEFKHAKSKGCLGTNGEWNSLDHYVEGETANLHYTNMATQPWTKSGHKYESLWVNDLKEAVECGFIDKDLVLEHQSKRYIRKFI